MVINRLNQVWLSDITYIRIRAGFVYLAAIPDAYSRKVISYAVCATLDTALTLKALRMAIEERQAVRGVIHHSDQGVQYASSEYVEELKRCGFEISMARRGNPYENAMMESFFKTLKYEEVYLYEYETLDDVVARLPYFIEEGEDERCIISCKLQYQFHLASFNWYRYQQPNSLSKPGSILDCVGKFVKKNYCETRY